MAKGVEFLARPADEQINGLSVLNWVVLRKSISRYQRNWLMCLVERETGFDRGGSKKSGGTALVVVTAARCWSL